MIPFENTRRWPRFVSWRGMKLSPAWKRRQTGEVGEARVGREHEDQHRAGLQSEVEQPARAGCRRRRGRRSARSRSACLRRTARRACATASTDSPRNIAPSSVPMMTSVVRAFFHAGLRNAGTPLEIASTPVTAAPPDAKACSTTNSVAPEQEAVARAGRSATTPCGAVGRRRAASSVHELVEPPARAARTC